MTSVTGGSRRCFPAALLAGCTRVQFALALFGRRGGVCFESAEREDSPGKMATARFAEHLPSSTGAAADMSRLAPGSGASGYRSGSNPPESGTKKCAACAERRPGGSPAACPLCPARRVPGIEERLRRRSDPERGSSRAGRRDCDCPRGRCLYPGEVQLTCR